MPTMHRRTLLGLPVVGALAITLTACGEDPPVPEPDQSGGGIVRYGDDPSQFGELYLPDGVARGVVVVIHGGFWKSAYDYTLGSSLAASLAAEGWVAWNLEYRRVGDDPGGGGGTPATFDDVAAGIDKLAELDLDLSTVVTLGHSAGGHLAAWAAGRSRYDEWAGGVDVTHVISQAGVLDLQAASAAQLGGRAADALLGHPATTDDERYDPQQQIPLAAPVWCVHGTDDAIVPISQSEDYVAAATDAGATAELVAVDGDHFVVIDVTSEAWTQTLAILDSIA